MNNNVLFHNRGIKMSIFAERVVVFLFFKILSAVEGKFGRFVTM